MIKDLVADTSQPLQHLLSSVLVAPEPPLEIPAHPVIS
jgi:hypothetical protein